MSRHDGHPGALRPASAEGELRPLRELLGAGAGDDARLQRAALLLSRAAALPEPVLPMPAQARVAAALVEASAPRPQPWRWLLLGGALAAGATAAAVALAPRPELAQPAPRPAPTRQVAVVTPPAPSPARAPREVDLQAAQALAGPRARLVLPGDGLLLLLGEGAAARHVQTADGAAVDLHAGRLVIRSGARAAQVRVGATRVVRLPPGALAEVEVRALRLARVAAYVGDAQVMDEAGRTIELRAGTALGDGEVVRPTGERAAVEALLVAAPRRPRPALALDGPAAEPVAAEAPVAAPVAAPAAEPGEAPSESRLLVEALRRLRRERDPAAALALLDRHRAAFPQGALQQEAAQARVEALIALHRSKDALAELDHLPLRPGDGAPRAAELLLLRGELRAAAGRCQDAEVDFSAALASPPGADRAAPLSDEQGERALYGRASCRARRGERAAANEDLRELLRRAPTGRFSDQARDALGR